MKTKFFYFFILFCFLTHHSTSQKNTKEFSLLFYNTENLFDPNDAPQSGDDEFTPKGERHWTFNRLNKKLLNLSKVILSSAGWSPPAIVTMCEIENRNVLERFIKQTPLNKYPYHIIHKESPDHRGIDVAVLYNSDQFYPLQYNHYPLMLDNCVMETREVLYLSGVIYEKDTIHLFVNHWPSRYSGLMETKTLRNSAAKILRQKVDELFSKYADPKIIIMGDFNDQPNDESISSYLKAKRFSNSPEKNELYNLSGKWGSDGMGTLKFQSQWFVFDQIIVSSGLIDSNNGFVVNPEKSGILKKEFLLEKDERYGGLRPYRTYYGYKYIGGFSDHLPVILELKSDS